MGWASCQIPAALLPSCCSGLLRLLRALGGAAQNAQNLVFLHDQEIFAVDLDFRSGIFAEQDPVALFYRQGSDLPFVVTSRAHGNHDALLGLLLGRVGDDNATANRLRFLNAADKNAVMQRGQLLCHANCSFRNCSKKWDLLRLSCGWIGAASTPSYRVLIIGTKP